MFFFAPCSRIKDIKIEGGSAEIQFKISSKLLEILNRKVFKLIPADGFFVLNKDKIKKEIIEACGLKSASLAWKFPNSLIIKTEQRESKLNWCAEGNCAIIDSEAVKISDGINSELFVVNESCEEIEKGRSAEKVKFIVEISESISTRFDIKPKSFYLENCLTQKLVLKTNIGFDIYFNISRSSKSQLEALYGILYGKIPRIDWDKLEYIDLQVEGRVYYRSGVVF